MNDREERGDKKKGMVKEGRKKKDDNKRERQREERERESWVWKGTSAGTKNREGEKGMSARNERVCSVRHWRLRFCVKSTMVEELLRGTNEGNGEEVNA